MKEKYIDTVTAGYLATVWYTLIYHQVFYRKIQVINRQNIPRDKPVIYAPNHQNAVMDALAVLFTSHAHVVFVARSDVFKHPVIRKVLTFFKMLPIFRMRDGAAELKRNEEIFNTALEVLHRRNKFCIMPEGSHGNQRKLRPLVKGIFRIALMAQEKFGEEDAVQIVPVGLDYSNYSNFRSKLLIQFGEPISVAPYYKKFLTEPARTINELRNRLSEELEKYMIDIQSEEYYQTYMDLRAIYNPFMRKHLNIKKKNLYSRFRADKETIRCLAGVEAANPDDFRALADQVTQFMKGVRHYNFRPWIFSRNNYPLFILLPLSLLLIAFFPIFLYGYLNNIIVYHISVLILKKVKDLQFHSSVKFVLFALTTPVIYFIQFALAWIFTGPGWIKWAYLLSLPVTGLIAHEYFITFKKARSMWKYWFLTVTKNSFLKKLKSTRKDILAAMDELIKK